MGGSVLWLWKLLGFFALLWILVGCIQAIPAALLWVMEAPKRASRDAHKACREAFSHPDRSVRHHDDGVGWTLHSEAGPHGLPTRIEYRREAQDLRAGLVHIRIELVGGLPAGTTLEAGSGGSTLGDPILDGRVEVSSSSAQSAEQEPGLRFLRARLQDPRHDLRGCLMDVLVGLPRSRVHEGGVEIEVRHDAHPLPELLERLGALAAALSDPPDPPPGSDAQTAATPESERSAARGADASAGRQKA